MIGNFPTVLNFNRLFLKLNRYACNWLPVLPDHSPWLPKTAFPTPMVQLWMRVKGSHHYKVTALCSCVKWPLGRKGAHRFPKAGSHVRDISFSQITEKARDHKKRVCYWEVLKQPNQTKPNRKSLTPIAASLVWPAYLSIYLSIYDGFL